MACASDEFPREHVNWLTTNEAARMLGYSDGSVLRHAIRRGDLEEGQDVIKRGNRWFIRRDAAIEYHRQMLDEFAQRRPPYRGPQPQEQQTASEQQLTPEPNNIVAD